MSGAWAGADAATPPSALRVRTGAQAELRPLEDVVYDVAVGIATTVMLTIIEEDVTALAGPRGRHDRTRTAARHGTEGGSLRIAGRRIRIRRPRVRSAKGGPEVLVPAYEAFASTQPVDRAGLERILAMAATRADATPGELDGVAFTPPVPIGTSAAGRRFLVRLAAALDAHLSAKFVGVDVQIIATGVVQLDGRPFLAIAGASSDGTEYLLGLGIASEPASAVVARLCADLQRRGLDLDASTLWGELSVESDERSSGPFS